MELSDLSWLGDLLANRVKISAEKEAVYDLDQKRGYSYQDLNFRAERLAGYLVNELNLEKKERIAFLSRNRIEMFDGFFAAGKTGTIFVPYNTRLSVVELAELIKNESPRVLFYEEFFAEKVQQLKNKVDIENYFVLSDGENNNIEVPDSGYQVIENYEGEKTYKSPEINFEDIHLIMHTGGTTGLPKGAKISHRSVLYNSLNEIVTWSINQQDSAHILLPLFHTGGWHILTLPILQAGGRILINRAFDPGLSLKVIEEEKPSLVFGAATIFRVLSQQDDFYETDFSSVRWVMSGAAPTPKEVMKKYWDKGIKFCAGYGLTEGGPNNLSVPADFLSLAKLKNKYDSVGIPFYFTEVKIVDEEGRELPAEEEGELIFSGPQIFSGYWNNEEETRQTLKNGWVYTGDMARKDKDGYYYIVGRKKNMFISGGENIFPPEIENKLYKMPEIHEVCVIAVPDKKWGEVGKAVISLEEGAKLEKDEIINFLKEKLAGYKIPKYVAFVKEIPKNSVGKIVSSQIEKEYGKPEDNNLEEK